MTRVHAVFTRLPGNLDVTVGGPGAVVSQPAGISCGTTATTRVDQCSGTFPAGVPVTLIPVPAPGGAFAFWGAACAGALANSLGSCALTPGSDPGTSATFRHVTSTPEAQTLTVDPDGRTGLTSSPAGIDCLPKCSAKFASGTVVTLGTGIWGGDCVGLGEPCTVVVDAATKVAVLPESAAGTSGPVDGVNVTVAGYGKVVGGRSIHCSPPTGFNGCMAPFPDGTHILLRAIPTRKTSRRVRWSGELCPHSRARTCAVPVFSNLSGTVTFGRR